MKAIKAYVRVHMVDKVIRGLEDAGFTEMTVIDVRAIRKGLSEDDLAYSVELAKRYMNVATLELVVPDRHVDQVRGIIAKQARTGLRGDGLIYVCPVEDAMHIASGESGEAALESSGA